MSKENITNEDLVKIMKDMLKWLKFFGFEKLKKILDENFNEEYEYLLYEQSDGLKTTRELAENLPISRETKTSYWDKWTELGIMEKIPVKGGGTRGKKIFTLSELGIDISKFE